MAQMMQRWMEMPTYQYKARDQKGEAHSGVFIADNVADLRHSLRSKDLMVTQYGIVADRASRTKSQGLFGPKKVKLYDLVVMSRQMASLVRAGVTVVESLDVVADQSDNPTLAESLQQVRLDILSGDSMAQAMGKHPKVFSELYVALVEAGETGGMLEDTLEVAADQLDKQATLREQVKSALLYPIIVIVAAVGVVIFMLIFIVPVFQKVYDQFNATLPTITRLLITMSDLVLHRWYYVAAGAAAVYFGLRAYNSTDEGRHTLDKFKLGIPMIGPLLRKIAVAQVTQTFAGTTKGGIPIISALQVSAGTTNNVIIRDAVWRVSDSIREGSPLSASLEETGEFPPMVTRMVASGEKSGNLDEMLAELTHFYERDIEHSVDRLTRMMEPVLICIVGGIVLFVLLALYMPVFNLSQVIRKN
ncbi:MAG: type II secretion system F family protein [Chloroflexi bacterium]|nr:type II secretion system F family protein [Chloroflexota bacterium]